MSRVAKASSFFFKDINCTQVAFSATRPQLGMNAAVAKNNT